MDLLQWMLCWSGVAGTHLATSHSDMTRGQVASTIPFVWHACFNEKSLSLRQNFVAATGGTNSNWFWVRASGRSDKMTQIFTVADTVQRPVAATCSIDVHVADHWSSTQKQQFPAPYIRQCSTSLYLINSSASCGFVVYIMFYIIFFGWEAAL